MANREIKKVCINGKVINDRIYSMWPRLGVTVLMPGSWYEKKKKELAETLRSSGLVKNPSR